MPILCALLSVIACTYLAFHRCRRCFFEPFFLPEVSRCSNTITSAPNSSAHPTMNLAVFTAMSSLIPFATAHKRGVFLAPCCCAFLIRFTAFHRQSSSAERRKKRLPTTVPSDSRQEQVQALLIPRSTARIFRSITGRSLSSVFTSYGKSRYHSFPLFCNVGEHCFMPAQCLPA